ncbi:biotin-dependent carboxyltransferase family protein [Alteribacillus sp. HJP-4]|uniref:5-oxoprolinase subunit C family protein n=1 Tax=Alteribacillus sp. HJP-4 TaxID=2775394 RepID=UPI0035CD044A
MNKVKLCRVRKPGMFTTMQDAGRTGYLSQGLPPSGAMDHYAFTAANLLVGNHLKEAVLEMTLTGPELIFEERAMLALTGGDFQPRLNGKQVDMWTLFQVEAGDELTFRGPKSGARLYLAVAGGFHGDSFLNSQSTYVKAKAGGVNGRTLEEGDELYFHVPEWPDNKRARLHFELIPAYEDEQTIRVVEGPEESAFTEEGLDHFYNSAYTITNNADRMGYRLEGKKITHKNGADIHSDAIVFGTIQVAANGLPIILMADRQTTGGYTRIANVITVDLPKLAQMKPGQKVYFKKIEVKDAVEAMRAERKQFSNLAFAIHDMMSE